MNRKTVEIQCTGAATLSLDEITEFQGTLKNRTKKDLDKIKKSILKYRRLHHSISWANAVPVILSETYKKGVKNAVR